MPPGAQRQPGSLAGGLIRLVTAHKQGGMAREEDQAKQAEQERLRQQADQDRQRAIEMQALEKLLLERSVNTPPPARPIDPLSSEGIDARIRLERETKPPTVPAQRNIDPLSPEGIDAAIRREQGLNRVKPAATDTPKLTEGQRRGQMLHSVASEALPILERATAPGYFESFASKAGANELLDEERQIIDQAARQFTSSYLYLVSGATASPQEVDNLAKQIVPQRGDKPSVLARKRQAVQTMAKAMEQFAGVGGGQQPASSPPPAAGAGPDPEIAEVEAAFKAGPDTPERRQQAEQIIAAIRAKRGGR